MQRQASLQHAPRAGNAAQAGGTATRTWRQYCHSQQTSAQLLGRHMPWSIGIRRSPSTRMLPALRSAGSRRQMSSCGGGNSGHEEHASAAHAVQGQGGIRLCLSAIKSGI